MVDVEKIRGKVEFRNVRGLEIPKKAWKNSKFEFIFLRHIPPRGVVKRLKFKRHLV